MAGAAGLRGGADAAGDSCHKLASLAIPRQHGAWAVLLLSFVVGVAGLGRLGLDAVLALLVVISGFVGRHALAAGVRLPTRDGRRTALFGWAAIFASVAALSLGALLLSSERLLLVPLSGILLASAGVSTVAEWKRLDRTTWGELLNMLGLSLVVPFVIYATTGRLGPEVLGLWLALALFVCGGVFHVRYLVRGRVDKGGLRQRLRAGAASALFHAGALVALVALSRVALVPTWTWLALVPNTAKALWPVARPQRTRPAIRRIGFAELAHSLLFLILTILAFRLPEGFLLR